jgi:hypothetical protein
MKTKFFAVLAPVLASATLARATQDCTVRDPVDPGGIDSLRSCINIVQAGGGGTISFELGGGNPVIKLTSGLPFITKPVIINGATGGATRIDITGALAGNAYGLVVGTGSDGSRVSSLVIRNFSIDGLVVASNVTVENCYIGTDATGTVQQPNGNDGIRVDGNNNIIGGTTAGTGNVISGNVNQGVHLILSASGNQIVGNRIGVNAGGTAALGNGSNGVYLDCTSGNSITNNTVGGAVAEARNIISGNFNGIQISGAGATGNKIQGNYIGTDVNGTSALGNFGIGVYIQLSASNTLGGTNAGEGNVISGNGGSGVWIFYAGATGNKVQGNYIGTNATGTNALGNGANGAPSNGVSGISVGFGASDTIIGGTNATARNIISGNAGNGIEILSASPRNTIQGNFIGTDINGTANLGNLANGIYINDSATNTIGGAGAGNTIAFNSDRGVTILGSNGTSNAILGNSIFSNGSLGIDLNNDGVTPNDAGDSDNGPNNLQNYPVLSSATYNASANATVVQGSLNSIPGATFTIELFSSPAADPTLFGEGQTFRGSTQVTTNGIGDISFSATVNAPVPGGQVITATATDASNNTSEFSKAVLVAGPSPTPTPTPITLGNISTRLRVETGDNALIGGLIVTGTQQKKVIIRAIGPSLPVPDALADPVLELHDGSGNLIASNDNWVDSPDKQAIIDSMVAPTNDLESAIIALLDPYPAHYTAIVRGVNNGTGIGLVEAYDLDRTVDAKLANISTRGFVQGGDDVMIGGFIIVGPGSLKVIARAIGPSLTSQGVANALQDPTLELHDGNGTLVAANDNWKDTQQAEIEASGVAPTNDLESAIVATLNPYPATYTAIVRGVNDTTGVALVEVYALN